jgi:hypothetical protein
MLGSYVLPSPGHRFPSSFAVMAGDLLFSMQEGVHTSPAFYS